jgi:protein-S-isoprenylcysteine O-methyltransferase Ste14
MSGAAWRTLSAVLLTGCWGAFALVWVAGALYNARRGPRLRERATRSRFSMWSSSVVVKTGHALRTAGPYAITRHPIYTGLVGMLLGTALISDLGRWTAVFALGVAYLALKARAEERLLSGFFPEYERYRRRVPQLIPKPHPFGGLLRR